MIEIFQRIPDISTGVLKPASWPYVREGLQKDISIVENYYKHNIRPVRGNHILVRYLQSLGIPYSLPVDRYYYNVDDIALTKSVTQRMTSYLNKGMVHRGLFYGDNTPEIIIANDNPFDYEYVNANWKDVSAVRVLMHPKSDLNFTIPNGKSYSDETGLVVIYINVSMLAVQYRAFKQSMKDRDDVLDTTHFVGAYVLPNMIRSQTTIAIFNRLYNAANEVESNNDVTRKHPFAYPDYRGRLDNVIKQTLKNISVSPRNYRHIFHALPSLYKEDMYYDLKLPKIMDTRAVSWAVMLSRLKMVNYMITVAGDKIRNQNQAQLNQIYRAMHIYDVYNVFRNNLPIDVYFMVEEYLINFEEAVGRKL